MYYVYILTNQSKRVMYVGFTSDLAKRVIEHREGVVDGFTKKYHVTRLVYYECGEDYDGVLEREKEIKKWRRDKKNALVESMNPTWRDLFNEILE